MLCVHTRCSSTTISILLLLLLLWLLSSGYFGDDSTTFLGFFFYYLILREGAVNQFLEMRIDRFENGQTDRTDDDADVWEMMAVAVAAGIISAGKMTSNVFLDKGQG